MRFLAAATISSGQLAAGEESAGDAERFFEARVRPLLVARCQECHGDSIAEAGLRLDSRRAMLAGGQTGPAVVPGDAAKSRLLAAVRQDGGLAMPPDGRLSADEVAILERWVQSGAAWSGSGGDDDPHAAGPPARDMAALLAEARAGHWAFQPVRRQEPPRGSDADGLGWEGGIDRFIAGRLVSEGLSPSPEADPRALHRRLHFDLTGLPPPADEADAFVASYSERALRDLVERLLASREHAEHWARKWLDLARYADTMGYAFDNQSPLYPFAWTYRDWVIDAFEKDVPYDRFLTLQIAADRLEPPVPKEDLAALGFLTVGRSFLGNNHDIIDDRIDLVTRGLMGLTVACARCHDHKYEPVSTADYYALHGIFDSCVQPEEMPQIGEAQPGPEADAFARKLAELRQSISDHEQAVHVRGVREAVGHAADYLLEVARPRPRGDDGRPPRLADGYELEQLLIDRLRRLLDKKPDTHPILGPWMAVAGLGDDAVGPRLEAIVASWGDAAGTATMIHPLVRQEILSAKPRALGELAAAYARLVMRVAPEYAGGPPPVADEPAEVASLRALLGAEGTPLVVTAGEGMRIAKRDEQTEHRRRKMLVTKHLAEAPGAPPHAMVLVDRERPHDSRILLRGNPGRPGDVVKRRLPMLLGGAEMPAGSSGRLELARAIASADNPLTPRVVVNWVWTHHFGRGLVDTPGDLGLRGEAPSHPELLDDLARRFIEEGAWSLRWLHREIVTSRTFRQTSTIRRDLAERDPDNRLFARAGRRRLGWESWRDSLLVAAGTLDREGGGRGVDPVAIASMGVRSVYAKLDRQDVPGIMRVFDIANPDTAVHVRPQTSVPQQALAALNAPLVVEAARRVAARVDQASGDAAAESDRVRGLWRAVLSRNPSDDELAMALGWLAEETAAADGSEPAMRPRERLAHALLATAEFQHVD